MSVEAANATAGSIHSASSADGEFGPVGTGEGQMTWQQRLFQPKQVELVLAESSGGPLVKTMNLVDLTLVGIGGMIGAGIFVITGVAAATQAGPAVVISFIIAAVVAGLAAMCYAELSSMIPVSGSAYIYTYATMGEFAAWIVAWNLTLEMLMSAAAVAVSWSGYLVEFFKAAFGVELGSQWTNPPIVYDVEQNQFVTTGDYVAIPSVLISLICMGVLLLGMRESKTFNNIACAIKIIVILMFIIAGAIFVNPANWNPFVPPGQGFGEFGVSGIFTGATNVFFSYIGFDNVATAASEAVNPNRDVPWGILLSLLITTILYIAVALVCTGLVPYTELNVPAPVAYAISTTGLNWLVPIIDLGALAGLTTVVLICLYAQTRVFEAVVRDGLLPSWMGKISKRFKVPWVLTLINGVLCAILSGVFPIDILAELTSVGTLFTFVLVALAVILLKAKQPDRPRLFSCPNLLPCLPWRLGSYIIPGLALIASIGLCATATVQTLWRWAVYNLVGIVFYFVYSYWHSNQKHFGADGLPSATPIELQKTTQYGDGVLAEETRMQIAQLDKELATSSKYADDNPFWGSTASPPRAVEDSGGGLNGVAGKESQAAPQMIGFPVGLAGVSGENLGAMKETREPITIVHPEVASQYAVASSPADDRQYLDTDGDGIPDWQDYPAGVVHAPIRGTIVVDPSLLPPEGQYYDMPGENREAMLAAAVGPPPEMLEGPLGQAAAIVDRGATSSTNHE